MMLNLSRIHFPVTTLGPGNRIGIWFQGCSIRCKGCISVDTWGMKKGSVSVDEIISVIDPWLDMADGITISGGEPFDQPEVSNWIDVAEITGNTVSRNYLAGLIVNELLSQLNIYQHQGSSPFLDVWRQYNVMQGKEIMVHVNNDMIVGVFHDISEQGELILQCGNGKLKYFQCGEVSVRTKN